MFDLNSKEFSKTTSKIFNGGVAGLVTDNKISVEKRAADKPDTYPDYKLIIEDTNGATVNAGFYYFTPNTRKTEEENKLAESRLVSRVVSIARAIIPEGFELPKVESSKQALDIVFDLVNKAPAETRVNVYVNYGTTFRPSQYIGLRYFNFIEKAGTTPTTLIPNNADELTRITEDKRDNNPFGEFNSNGSTSKTSDVTWTVS